MSRSDATRVHPPLPAVVHAELGAGLSLDAAQLTPAALSTFKHAASMANPKFYELQRLRKSTWDTPAVRPRLRHHPRRSTGPARAACATPSPEWSNAPARGWPLTDVRNPGREIEVAFTAELNPEQAAAVSAMLAHDDGVLVAPPGSGKTVMACAVIAERGTSTLILVDRKALAEQWRTRIETVPGHPARAGRRRPAQAHRRRGHRDAALAGPARRRRRTHQRIRARRRRRMPPSRRRRVRPLRQTHRRAVLARAHRHPRHGATGSASSSPGNSDPSGTPSPTTSPDTLADALHRRAPDHDACCTSTTPTSGTDDVDPSASGRARRGPPRPRRRPGPQRPDRRRRRRRPGTRPQLPRPHPTGRPRRGPHRTARRARAIRRWCCRAA